MLKLQVEKRNTKDDAEALRKKDVLPAVFYGRKEESTPIAINMHDFEKAWKESGETAIISLEGVGKPKDALIHEVSVHPVSGKPVHADFYVIEEGQKLHVSVPLEFVGTSKAVKELGGTLVKVLHELEIEVEPKDLPQHIEVDVSGIEDFETNVSVKDLDLPKGVTPLLELEDTVALVAEPKEEEELEEELEEDMEGIDMEAIEVEEKGKKEEVGEVESESEEGGGEEAGGEKETS